MKFEFENKTFGNEIIENPSWFEIEHHLNEIKMMTKSFFILSSFDSFVQCAGARAKLTVECKFEKRYRIGLNKEDKSPNGLNYSSGFIKLNTNEILTLSSAKEIFHSFLENNKIPEEYILRELNDDYL